MQDDTSVLIVLGVVILAVAAVLTTTTPVRPDEATISPEQKAGCLL